MRTTSAKKAFQGNGKNEQKLLIPEGLGQIPVARLGTTTTFLLWCLQTHGCANVEQTHDIFPRIWIILSFKYQRNHKNLSSETEKTRMSMAVHPSSVPWDLFILKRSRRDIKVDSTGPWRPCHLAPSSGRREAKLYRVQNKMSWLSVVSGAAPGPHLFFFIPLYLLLQVQPWNRHRLIFIEERQHRWAIVSIVSKRVFLRGGKLRGGWVLEKGNPTWASCKNCPICLNG